jgi:hemolysin activation/secretion protein
VLAKIGLGNRTLSNATSNQFFGQIDASHHFELNQKNSIFLKSQCYYLQSDKYVVNELYRCGGINSIRGFNENSLQANVFSGIMAEYRFLLAPNLYLHSITDYGYLQDKTSATTEKLLGLGFGFGLFTKNGFFNLMYANGSTSDQSIKLSNSIVHISFKTNF